MDPDSEIQFNLPPFLRIYKSGRVERLLGTAVVPPSLPDPATAVSSKDVTIDPATAVSARLYLPPNPPAKIPILVYFHGGAFCTESAFSPSYHTFLNSLVARSRVLAVSVNYRLAPEHKLPAAYHDAWAALNWAASARDPWLAQHGDPNTIFVGGDSAGANIAHDVAVRGGDVAIEGMMLIHPYFGRETGGPIPESWRVLGLDDVSAVQHTPMEWDGGKVMAGVRCRRVVVCVAEEDGLRERGAAYFEGLKGSGWRGECEFVESEGEGHVFHLRKPGCAKGVELMEKLNAFINNKLE